MRVEEFDVFFDNGDKMVTIPDYFTPDARAKYAVLFAASEDLFIKAAGLKRSFEEGSLSTTAMALEDFCRYFGRLQSELYSARRKANEKYPPSAPPPELVKRRRKKK